MKKLLLSAACFAIATLSFAQGISHSYFGIKLGMNSSSNSYDPSTGLSVSSKTGFAGGIYYNLALGRVVSIQPELLYSAMGSKLKTNITQSAEATINLDYFSIPILFKVSPTWRLGLFAGPQFDFLLSAKAKTGSASEDIKGSTKGSDFAGTIGAEFWLTRNIGLYGRYIGGFNDINNDNTDNTKIKNKGWQFGLTIGFRKATKAPVVAAPVVPVVVDTDGDGIADANDKCPNVAGLAKYGGCPIPDTDGDGINDEQDKCPAVAGLAKYGGCPIPDTDGDGINDENDKCPTVAGLDKYGGCPIPDTDGDGINDEQDKCPNTPGIASNLGCPEMVFYYKKADANLTAEDKANLDKLVEWMGKHPDLSISVEGHTSTVGATDYNQKLSEKRAQNSVKYLVSKGIDASRLKAVGYGEQFPIGDNSTEEGRAQSRRVVMKIAQ